MKKFLLFFMITINAFFAFAQNTIDQNLPSFNPKIRRTEIRQIYNLLPEKTLAENPSNLKQDALKALKKAQEAGNTTEEAKQFLNIAIAEILVANYDDCIKNLNFAKKRLSTINSKDAKAKEIEGMVFCVDAIALSGQDDYLEALKDYVYAIQLFEDADNSTFRISQVYSNIAHLYFSINDYDKSLKYFTKAYELRKELKLPEAGRSSSFIGRIYLELDQPEIAKKFLDESLKILPQSHVKIGPGELYYHVALYYQKIEEPKIAKDYLLKSEKEFQATKNNYGLTDVYVLFAAISFSENNIALAKEFAEKSLEISKKLSLNENEMKSEKILYEIYFKSGDEINSLIHLRDYDIKKEQLQKLENTKERIRTQLDFEDEKAILQQHEKSIRNRIILGFAAFILAASLIAGFFYYRNNQLHKNLILQKQLAEYEHKALHLQMNPHFLFNCHAAISSFILQNGKDEAVKYLAKFSKLMRLTLEFSKESAIPIDKEILALQNYLELEQLRFNNKFDFKISKSKDIEDDTAIPSLLLQPYVENAIIHGVIPKGSNGLIQVNFIQKNDILQCEIIDNGVGIETSRKSKEGTVRAHKSMALEITKKRLETMEKLDKKKVLLTIEEIKGKNGVSQGTKVTIELPLEYIQD